MSPRGDAVLSKAAQESIQLGHLYIGVEHIFLGLAEVLEDELKLALAAQSFELSQLIDVLRTRIQRDDGLTVSTEIAPTPRCHRVLNMAVEIANRTGSPLVEPPHLLEAIFRERRSVPVRLIHALDLDVTALQEATSREPEPEPTPTPLLEKFGRDLTANASKGLLSPVIGREEELDLLAQVLLRKNKNNPVLVGEAGVGKTAVVEGFAQRLTSESCPEPLRGRRLVELSIGSLVAGTKFRGEFEERILGIAKEVEAHPEIILFLDEIHTLVGAGSTGGGESLDASNILKPALARGEIRCIGATTIDEYRRHIEPDPALERRFEKVMVDEPTSAEALEILINTRAGLEAHHQVDITPEALEAAIELTVKHVVDRQLPDKALDAIDQSCARRRLQRYATGDPQAPVSVGASDVANTVSQWTGIPLERISGEAAKSLLSIEDELTKRVVGQEKAVRAVARTVLTAKAGLSDPNRPLGVFLFTGPTGVGKTHLAKSLAEVLFGDVKRLVRIDMSEYMEPHTVSNLIGAPPGYVGHEQEGTLISALRTHPHCIVLFDEMEKAHPKVFDIFLQIFDEGRLTGTHGKTADFTQSVVILTSNIDIAPQEKAALGFAPAEETGKPKEEADPRETLAGLLRPELVNRIDEIVHFGHLSSDLLRSIVDRYVADIEALLRGRNLHLDLDEAVYEHLLELADCKTFGARELQRVVDRHLRQPLATEVLRMADEVGRIRVDLKDGKLEFQATSDHGLMA